MNAPELLLCPFCGGDDLRMTIHGLAMTPSVICAGCGSSAISAARWNARADLARPKVKALVWERSVSLGEVYEASSVFGEYICGVDNEDIAYGSPDPNPKRWLDYRNIDEAKAAAQADYEARVLACLEGGNE